MVKYVGFNHATKKGQKQKDDLSKHPQAQTGGQATTAGDSDSTESSGSDEEIEAEVEEILSRNKCGRC